jgi:hypothetical protein
MDYDSGSTDDFVVDVPAPAPGEAISLWLVFGICVVSALALNLMYNCSSSGAPEELSEGLVSAQVAQPNDEMEDDDEVVFGRQGLSLDSRV